MTTEVIVENNIDALAKEMLSMEQIPCPVTHHFLPNLYIREGKYTAGTVIVGQHHKKEHLCVMLTGRMLILNNDGSVSDIRAPKTFLAKKGKKAVYILEDMIFQSIHVTDETDVETLETLLYEPNPVLTSWRASNLQLTCSEILKSNKIIPTIYNLKETNFPLGSYKIQLTSLSSNDKCIQATANIELGEYIAPLLYKGELTPAGKYIKYNDDSPNTEISFLTEDDLCLLAIKHIDGMVGGIPGDILTVSYNDYTKLQERIL